MLLDCIVQEIRPGREYRDKNGGLHAVNEVVVMDVGEHRVTGVGLVLQAERDRQPETFAAIGELTRDEKIKVGVEGIRLTGGEYRLTGAVIPKKGGQG